VDRTEFWTSEMPPPKFMFWFYLSIHCVCCRAAAQYVMAWQMAYNEQPYKAGGHPAGCQWREEFFSPT